MVADPNQFHYAEGQWEELIQHPDRFAGRRVRVTVLSENQATAPSMLEEINHWLDEGNTLQMIRPAISKPNAFSDAVVEKFRKQGLVL